MKIKNHDIAKIFYRDKSYEPGRDAKGKVHMVLRPKKGISIETSAEICQRIIDQRVKCSVEVITLYKKDYADSSAKTEAKSG